MSTDPGFKEEQEVTLRTGEEVTLHADEAPVSQIDKEVTSSTDKLTPPVQLEQRPQMGAPKQALPRPAELNSDRLTPGRVLRNIKKSLLAADSVLNYAMIAVLSLVVASTAGYFKSTASARGASTSAGTDYMPIAVGVGLLTGATGESDAAYAMMVASSGAEGVQGQDRAIELACKYVKDRNSRRSMVTDCLGSLLHYYSSRDYVKKDALIARLKEVLPQHYQMREALAWQQIRRQNYSQAILEMTESLKVRPEAHQYDRLESEKTLCKLWLASEKWNEVTSFQPVDETGSYSGLDLTLDKVDAFFHNNQLRAAYDLLGRRKVDEWQSVDHEKLWHGRLLLQQKKLDEARKYADELMDKGRESNLIAAGKLLKSEILLAECRRDSNNNTREAKLNKARQLVDDASNSYSATSAGALRMMQLWLLSGHYKKALDTYGLDQFEQESSDSVRDKALFYALRAECNLHLKSPSAAMEDVMRALNINPSLAKALEVGIQVCKATNDTARLNEFENRLSRVKNNPRLETEY